MTDEIRSRMVELLPRLRRFAVALTGDLDQGDDLVQETCVRALSRVDQYQPGTRLDSWMYRIAQNLWLDRMRAKKVRGVQVDVEAAEALAGPNGRTVVESRLALDAVGAAMAFLPEEQRVLIGLVCHRWPLLQGGGRHHRHAHLHCHEPAREGAPRVACTPGGAPA